MNRRQSAALCLSYLLPFLSSLLLSLVRPLGRGRDEGDWMNKLIRSTPLPPPSSAKRTTEGKFRREGEAAVRPAPFEEGGDESPQNNDLRAFRLRSGLCSALNEAQFEGKLISTALLSSTDKPLQLPLREHLFLKCKEREGGREQGREYEISNKHY